MSKLIPFPIARASTRERAPWCEFRNETADSADLYLYDEIGSYWDESDAAAVVKKIQALAGKRINLRINSPGGSVFDGIAIYNALARHDAEVTTYIDGLAASIASVIALAGRRVLIAENAMMMIHNPLAFVYGPAVELRKTADILDQIRETIITTYATRTGSERDVLGAWMNEEKWFTAAEAIEAKLADESIPGVKAAARFDLAAFGYVNPPPPAVYPPAGDITQSPTVSSAPRARLLRRQALLEKVTNNPQKHQ